MVAHGVAESGFSQPDLRSRKQWRKAREALQVGEGRAELRPGEILIARAGLAELENEGELGGDAGLR